MDRAGLRENDTLTPDDAPTLYDEKQSAQPSLSSGQSIQSRARDIIDHGNDIHQKDQQATREGELEADLEPVKSKQPSVNNATSIPNGGAMAWLQVLGAFFLLFNSWGIINTFGSYQAYYETNLLASSTPSAISWIGSIQAFLLLVVGALSGPIYDAGYFRALLFCGSILLVLGQMMLSLCTQYWQVLLAQAFCIGTGAGALFIPSVAILSTYFTTKIATAIGLAASGSSMGGVIYPIVFHKLLPKIGFAWTTRTIAFLILATMLVPNLVMRVRTLPPKSRSLLDLGAFAIPAYSLDVAGFFLGFMGLYMPFFYAQIYALQLRITDENVAFYLLAIMNSASVLGRILPNWAADSLGPFNVVIPCTFVSAVLCFCFAAATSQPGLIALIAFYGFFSGTFVSLPPTIIVHLSLEARDKIGTRLGQSFAVIAVGLLVGTPVGGAILEARGFLALWVYGGCMLVGSGVLLAVARVCHKGWGVMVKA